MIELEEIRRKIRTRYIIFAIVIMITLCMGVSDLEAVLAMVMVEVMCMFGATRKLNSQYRVMFSDEYIQKELRKIFDNLCYEPEKGFPYEVIDSTNMMNMGDRYNSKNYMSGGYKGIKFEQADVHIEQRHTTRDSKGRTRTYYVTLFKGRWLIFDFNKNFKANVQISQRGFGNSRVQTFFVSEDKRFKKVEMESEEFNKKFKVYAQSEHDAFYIITPSLMEKIERLVQNNSGKFLFCFVDQRLHIGISNNKDSFKPTNVFRELNEKEIQENISGDIKVITQFVDELNLDNKLFKVGV